MVRKLIILAVLIGTCLFYPCNCTSAAGNISQETIKRHIVKHSLEIGIDPALALSIAKAESGYCHEKKGPDGSVGVFQVRPSTAKKMGYNPYYLNDNIKVGLKYYQMMYKKFGSVELALAAYNAGPGNVHKYNGMPPFKGTKIFVSKIMKEYNYQKVNPDPAIKQAIKSSNNTQTQKQAKNVSKPQETKVTVEKNENKNVTPIGENDLLSLND